MANAFVVFGVLQRNRVSTQLVKKSICSTGDHGSIPGSRRSPGEGIDYPLQYSWAFLVVQMVNNPPAMRETWVQSLSWEDPLEEGMATHSNILAWRIPWTKEPDGLQSKCCKEPLNNKDNWEDSTCLGAIELRGYN